MPRRLLPRELIKKMSEFFTRRLSADSTDTGFSNLLPLYAAEMDEALEIQSPEILDSFLLFQPIYDFLHTDYHLCDGKCQKLLQDEWISGHVDLTLMESSIAQPVHRGLEPESWEPVNGTCFLSLMAMKKWINRDENGLIKVNKNDTFVVNIIQLMYSYSFYSYYYALPIHSFFPENQEMSSKISTYISLCNIKKKNDDSNQYSFAVIEHKTGPETVIGPYYPVKEPAVMVHSEVQCINEIKRQIKGREINITSILIFTHFCPCVKNKGCDSCMSQLAHFSEEMYNHQIEVYTFFQDFYAMGNKQLKLLKDPKIIDHFKWLIERLKEQHHISNFSCFHTKRHSSNNENYIRNKMLESDLLELKDINSILKFEITFPRTEMTSDEHKNYGELQADKLKIYVQQHYSEDISEKVYKLFHSVWCDLVDEEYGMFIFIDYFKSFADKLFYDYEKSISNHFILERVWVN